MNSIERATEARQDAADRIQRARTILGSAEAEGRAMTDREELDCDRLQREADQLLSRAERTERLHQREAELAEVIPTGRGPLDDPDDPDDTTTNRSSRNRPATTWRTRGGGAVPVLEARDSFESWVRSRGESSPRVTLSSYLRSMVCGAKTAEEVRALAEGADSAGGFTVPSILSAQLVDHLRAALVAQQAGARIVPLTSDSHTIAKVTADPTPAWRAENAEITATDPTFGAVELEPKSLAVLVKASRELVEDSLNLEQQLPVILASGLAAELDAVVMAGTGTPPEPEGILAATGVTEVEMGANGAAPTDYAEIVSLVAALMAASADVSRPVAVMAPRTWGQYAKLEDSTGQPLRRPQALDEVRFLTSSAMPITETQGTSNNASSIILGGWAEVLIGMRSQIRVEVLRERYADFMQVGFLCHLRADVALARPAGIGRLVGIIP
ncbi:MAG TPA: phage major capsid protein [Thermoanaerobaculia bacterium]|nr:phage major capsid protein [Thermoanaerobaculia bacterium]